MRALLSVESSACRNQKGNKYDEHQTHRAHRWRRRPRRCTSTNTAKNSPSTETALTAAEFNAKKRQNPKQQKLYNGLSASTRHTGMIKGISSKFFPEPTTQTKQNI
jgi:hypothetical protein